MTLVTQLTFIFLILFTTHNIYGKTPNNVQGHGVYNFDATMMSGSIEWASEIDPSGQIVFLFKSIKENTTVKFIKISKLLNYETDKFETVIVLLMKVKAENPICHSFTEIQEVNIPLNPLPVKEISLTGNIIDERKNIRIIIP